MENILQDSFEATESLTMVDLLQADIDNQIQAQDLSKRCGKDLNECTYSKGYLNQSVFACLTCACNSDNNTNHNNTNNIDYDALSGFCLACSMNCHLEHNVIELWHKRNFRCDCGNSKFKDSKQKQCLLSCKKEDINASNHYNHNFIGKYCYCDREYASSQHTMHQCLICQDWFHQTCIILQHLKQNKHLKQSYDDEHKESNDEQFFEYFRKLLIPKEESAFDAFICKNCAMKYEYLFVSYRVKRIKIGIKRSLDPDDDEIQSQSPKKRRKLNDNTIDAKCEIFCKRNKLNEDEIKNVSALIGGGLWFETECDWIEQLCHCIDCEAIYTKYGLKWLFEEKEDENVNMDVNDVNNINSSQQLTREFSTDAMIAESIQKLPRKQTLDALNVMVKGTDIIKQKLFEYIRANPSKKVIDQKDIHNIFKT